MHPRRIPLLLATGLAAVGLWLLVAPYTVDGTAGSPPDQLELTARCPSPAIDLVTDRDVGWAVVGQPANEGFLISSSRSPCASAQVERSFAGLALIGGGAALLLITRSRRRRRAELDPASEPA